VNILIAVASRHGGTRGIAEALGQELRAAGHNVTVQDAGAVMSLEGYDAALVGSAVYMGAWLQAARQCVERNAAALTAMPVWLFSSGPLGAENPQPATPLPHLDALLRQTGAREHRMFIGKLDKGAIGFGERVIAQAVKAPEGDFRDWAAIRAWADQIAAALPAPTVPAR
jgi:menaquinone-dependent protoporphyrinogen oxidase